MKQYKLIKLYPNSPDILGLVVKWGNYGLSGDCYEGKSDSIYRFTKTSVEDFPEFWEEIKEEKEYEIMQFNTPENTKLYVGRSLNSTWFIFDHSAGRNYERDDKWMIEHGYIINSIKRISDGEIFTVGDKIDGYTYKDRFISKFRLVDDKLWVRNGQGDSDLEDIKHSKTPLFTTEDNVPIYKGDEYWYYHEAYTQVILNRNADYAIENNGIKRFSTKQAAEDYIAKNKVLFVTEDGVEIKEWDKFWVVEGLSNKPWETVALLKKGKYWNIIEDGKETNKYFSTKEKAQEYIDMNKPMYSKHQLINVGKKLWWNEWIKRVIEELDRK